jgi:hypothetical protein
MGIPTCWTKQYVHFLAFTFVHQDLADLGNKIGTPGCGERNPARISPMGAK